MSIGGDCLCICAADFPVVLVISADSRRCEFLLVPVMAGRVSKSSGELCGCLVGKSPSSTADLPPQLFGGLNFCATSFKCIALRIVLVLHGYKSLEERNVPPCCP